MIICLPSFLSNNVIICPKLSPSNLRSSTYPTLRKYPCRLCVFTLVFSGFRAESSAGRIRGGGLRYAGVWPGPGINPCWQPIISETTPPGGWLRNPAETVALPRHPSQQPPPLIALALISHVEWKLEDEVEEEEEEAAKGETRRWRGTGEDGSVGCKAAECCRVQEGRVCFVCVDRNTYVPTFLLEKGRKKQSGGAYGTMRSRILHGHPRACGNKRTIRL